MNLVPNLEFSIKVVYFRRTMTLNLPVSKSMKTLIAAFFLLTSTVLAANSLPAFPTQGADKLGHGPFGKTEVARIE